MKRQAMEVSIKELQNKVLELFKEAVTEDVYKNSDIEQILNHKWSIPIINKTDESDTWKFE